MNTSDRVARVWFALFVLVVFCAGLGVGILVDRQIGWPRFPPPFGFGPRGGHSMPPTGLLVERLSRDLDLSAEQRARLEEVLKGRRAKVEALQGEIRARVEREHAEVRAEIRSILTPEQQLRFDREAADHPPLLGPPPPDRAPGRDLPGGDGRPGADRP